VTRIAGWDTHGLPVEIEVEKELKLNGKRRSRSSGSPVQRAAARACSRYQSDWEQLSNRIGYWLDYENPYVTCSNEYIESVWWLLQRLHQKDMLYRVTACCPTARAAARCCRVMSWRWAMRRSRTSRST
jgi:isoleucyl-tRNA synthetase